MKPADFEFISQLINKRSGLVLTEDKAYLLESRLMPVARKRGMKGLEDLISTIRTSQEESLLCEVTEAMTTNESFFFRDLKPFDTFRDVILPDLLASRAANKSFRIWCAASSSGQEPYSLAMVMKEQAAKLTGWSHEIIATDISTKMLAKAEKGIYSQFEVQRGLPIQMLLKYFKKANDAWQIDPSLRDMVTYKEFNLLNDPTALGAFDVVFCRNVLIYFDQPTKTRILDWISRMIPADGRLFLGGAETVLGITDKFKPVPGQRGVYCLAEAVPAAAAPAAATNVGASAS
ncbi:MAG: protein-glutamate O-methyltransferase [Alphaproteobacteria bacterium]|nr:protein-glutamate O-methyltransferase [Pseudomonadota bacterium]MCZ6467662.1 protein-glutamate O-methyltransferase [Alphaproteobacteria bacterium]MCZ6606297.1 protein-glutamate O-methyltransferase [Alphaproteobacteria bacterium]